MMIQKILFSTRLMAILFLVFGVAMAAGTFIETYYNTDTAKIWIYNAWWFEAIILFFLINFIGNIKRYRLHKKENWAVLLLHISWIFIIVGAFVTRYISDEGRMSIREGETADFYTSEQTYITAFVDGDFQGQRLRKSKQEKVLFAEATNNKFDWKSEFKGTPFEISYKNFVPNAVEGFISDKTGAEHLKLVESSSGTRHEHYLKAGEITPIHNSIFTLNNVQKGAFNIQITTENQSILSPVAGTRMDMATQQVFPVEKDTWQPLHFRSLYNFGNVQFVLPETMQKGRMGIVQIPQEKRSKNDENAVIFNIKSGNETREVAVLGRKDVINPPTIIRVNNLDFQLSYGSVRVPIPFQIKLNDFIADKYPGTENSYSSYKSRVSVIDTETKDHDIFMNNILNYRGYRFFQASFHPDEKGTILSVNHDFWGTLITYIGYTLLYIGLVASLFFGKTRFVTLSKKLKELQGKRFLIVIFALLFSGTISAQHPFSFSEEELNNLLKNSTVSKEHAEKFGQLVIQDDDGRMKPINTFSSELLRKISKYDTFRGMNADQVLLSILLQPQIWYDMPFFYIKKGNDHLHTILNVEKGAKFVKMSDFYDKELNYKLDPYLEDAYKTTNPTQIQKDFKEADLKLNLLKRALTGEILRIFPLKKSDNNKWISPLEYRKNTEIEKDSIYGKFINESFPIYLLLLKNSIQTKNYTETDRVLAILQENQYKHSPEIMPSADKISAEILYNKYDIFKNLFSYYLYAGVLLFLLLIVQVFFTSENEEKKKGKNPLKIGIYICKIAILCCFALHTLGLIARWYIAGHAPWSNAYESMIYVGWATMGAGIFFARRSPLSFAATAFVTAMILMIAHWNWMDPAIGTLQPVLNSYWLMLHVAVIVGSYGPFALGMVLGFLAMLLILFRRKKNQEKINRIIQELTIVNELSLTVGLVMLTIGNFLGGQWANESWGRYWGWDPKETWALISIMVYALVIHMRIVPGLRGRWAFNFMSVVAFASILMTYFGVNFYLSGLHSYATGEKVITPDFVYISATIVGILGISSFLKERNDEKTL